MKDEDIDPAIEDLRTKMPLFEKLWNKNGATFHLAFPSEKLVADFVMRFGELYPEEFERMMHIVTFYVPGSPGSID